MKYTFIKDGIAVVNGELIEQEGIEIEYNFTLKMNALKLFEEEYGKPLLKSLMDLLKDGNLDRLNELANSKNMNTNDALFASDALIDPKFVRALSSACYVKIEGNEAYNNEQTMEEFKESFVYDKVINNIDFVTKLLNMAIKSIFDDKKKKGNDSRAKK